MTVKMENLMFKKINCTQAYKAMLHFFDMISLETGDEEVGIFAYYGVLYSAIPGECPQTMDAAKWHDWMDGLKIVIGDDSITYEFELTMEQGYAAAYQYIVIFCNLGAEPSVHQLKKVLSFGDQELIMKSWLYNQWLCSVEYVLQEDPCEKYGLFFNEKAQLTERESFIMMQNFLDAFCKKNNNDDLIKLVQNSRFEKRNDYWTNVPNIIEPKILNSWLTAIRIIEKQKNESLNLLNAYNAMPIFLMNYFDSSSSTFIDKVIQTFHIDDTCESKFSSLYWNYWIKTVGIIKRDQAIMHDDVISIHTPISQDITFNIIQPWFDYQKNLIEFDLAQKVLSDAQGMQKVINEIKQQPRSYLLLDNEVTVLETYHIMTKLLELHGKIISEFAVDENGKPVDFEILLDWIRICEQVIKA